MFKLVIEDDEGNKTIVPVIRDEISIGRQEGNTIRLTERNVSRRHARLVRDEGSVYFEELSARYGTRYNGEKVDSRVPFKVGDVFTIGDYRLTLQPEAGAAVDASVESPETAVKPPEIPRASDGTELMPSKPARLVIVSSNFAGQEFPLDRKEMIIGRGEECDIIIDHRSVSTTHAKMVREPKGVYKIVDLNSKNGVKVSGEEYKAIHVKRGDVIELGHVRFRFVEPGENYVFSPMAFEDFDDVDTKQRLGPIPIIVALIFGIVLLGAFYMYLADNDSTAVAETKEEPVKEEIREQPSNAVKKIIADARGHIKSGEIEKAIAKLDTARDLNPTGPQIDEIDALLSDTAAWAPMSRAFALGRDYFQQEQYPDALSKFKEVAADDTTPIYALMVEQDYPDRTVNKILETAQRALNEGDKETALDAIEDVLLYDDENEKALILKQQIDKPIALVEKKKVVRVEKVKTDNRDKVKVTKVTPKLDTESGAELFNKAFSQFSSGNFAQAIRTCKTSIKKHKYRKCHNVIAASHLKLGNTSDACKHFKMVGKSHPDCE